MSCKRIIVSSLFVAAVFVVGGASLLAGDRGGVGAEGGISEDKAREIALDVAKGAVVVRTETERGRNGVAVFEILLVDDARRYEVTVDGRTGEVLKVERKVIAKDESGDVFGMRGEEPGGELTHDEVKVIALAKSGGGQVVESEKKYGKNGKPVFEVEVIDGRREYEFVIDGVTGEVLRYKEEAEHDD